MAKVELASGGDDPDLVQKLDAIFSKLTPVNLDQIVDKINQLEIDKDAKLRTLVQCFFEKVKWQMVNLYFSYLHALRNKKSYMHHAAKKTQQIYQKPGRHQDGRTRTKYNFFFVENSFFVYFSWSFLFHLFFVGVLFFM